MIPLLLVTGALAADDPTITLVPADAALDEGETATMAVVMDTVPTGLSGYNVTFALTDPSVGKITAVKYPYWAIMPVNSSLPADSVYVQAVDLMCSVGAGATNVTLCTLNIRGDAAGTTNLTITTTKIDDDVGGRYAPAIVPASITVEAIPTPTPTPSPVQVPELSFNPIVSTIVSGDTARYALVMDTVPTGLSGFNVTITMTNSSVGEITAVTYPYWASMPMNSSLPADSVYVQAVDLGSSVGSGATNVTFCTLTVRGDVFGEANLTITTTKIDDDAGGRYTPKTEDAIFVVENSMSLGANFTANITTGVIPLTVHFTDTSSGTPIAWLWTFGDGNTSTDQNPTHTYTTPGNYTVSLEVNGGADTCTRPAYIKVTPLLFGDANDDGGVNQADTLRVLKQVVGLSTKPATDTELFSKTDVHRNGAIEVGDALFIAQYNVGLRDAWFVLRE